MGIESVKNGAAAAYARQAESADVRTESVAGSGGAAVQQSMPEATGYEKAAVTNVGLRSEAEDAAAQQAATNAKMKKLVEEINKKAPNSTAIFGVHEATNRVTIKIIDKDTKEVLKEYPPEKTLDIIAKVWEMAGLMVDEKR
ncbi:MAG: flagellar protein FlaG [Clostridiales bacterium]|nr:flagellar protein FlaG [Clostridiales bacterium]